MERGFDIIDPEAEVFEPRCVLWNVGLIIASGKKFEKIVAAGFDVDQPEVAIVIIHSKGFGQTENAGVKVEGCVDVFADDGDVANTSNHMYLLIVSQSVLESEGQYQAG